MIRFIAKAVVFVTMIFGMGCSEVDSKVGSVLNLDTDLKVELIVAPSVNPDEQGNASPVFIRMYELKTPQLMEKADFISIYERDEEVLGNDFIARQELKRLTPGETREERFVLNPQTQYVALYAEFFNYKKANYKVIFPVKKNNVFRNRVEVHLTGSNITLKD